MDDEWTMPERKPHWACQSCGHQDHAKPMPADREKFYASHKPAKCPSCKSVDMMPSGF